MIIHITGETGSGKTTLGKRLAKLTRFKVVDLDDIIDDNTIDILDDPKYNSLFTTENMKKNKFFKLIDKRSQEDLDDIIDDTSKILILVGHSFNFNFKADYKFCIEIDLETLYIQRMGRFINDICSHERGIKKMLNDDKISIHKMWAMNTYKFKIRGDGCLNTCPPKINEKYKRYKAEQKKKGYKIMSADKIYTNILSLADKLKK